MNEDTTIAIVAHDAGGAEILACYVDQNKRKYHFSLEGPAKNIFEKKFGALKIESLENAIDKSDICLCGTGWQSELEWQALGIARKRKKKSISFLDHWTNYSERFFRNGIEILPDEIWVGDDEAKDLAQLTFHRVPISLVPNPYWLEIKQQLKFGAAVNNASGYRVLYVSENISQLAISKYGNINHFGYTEIDSICYFMNHLQLVAPVSAQVTLRPHPSDVFGKYDGVLSKYQQIKLSNGRPLIEEVLESDLVVGCESMALAIGVLGGKKVVSSIPISDVPCRLPQSQIIRLSDLVRGENHMHPPIHKDGIHQFTKKTFK